jgi:SHS2 domain-containing protein
MSFEEREHTADILMHIQALTLDDLFSEAVRSLMATMYRSCDTVCPNICRTISIPGRDQIELLQSFLSELLFLSETENIVFSFIKTRLTEEGLVAEIAGEPFAYGKHGGGSEVKGISFSGMKIERQKNEYAIDILFDV